MAYIINRFDGSELTVVDDGILDTTTSLGLVGRNYVGYGETQNENYVFLLENFAGNQPPARALSGQLWYDASNKTIRVYNGASWTAVGNAQVQETEPTPSQGGLWLKSTTNQLFVSDGAVWRLVGPEAIQGFNTTKLTSRLLRDSQGPTDRPVITVSINGEVIAIYSNFDFDIFSDDAIPGFERLTKGLNFKTGFSVSGNLKGNADTATKFLTSKRINTVSFDGTSDITIKSSTTNKLKPGNYILGTDWDGTLEDTWNIDATPQNRIAKVVARDSNGDFAANIITADLIGNIQGNVLANSGTSIFNNVVVQQTITGSTFTGNSATATKLQNPPTINTVLFDGTENITLPVPANTLTTDTLASNVVNSSLTNLGKLEYLEIEAPGLKVGDGNDLSIFIEGFIPTIRSDVTDIIKLELFTGSSLQSKSDVSFISARTVATDGGNVNPALVPDWGKPVLNSQKIMLGTPTYRWRNVFSEELTADSLNVLQVNSVGAEVQFNDPLKAAAGLIGDLAGNVVGNLVGNVTGNLTGAASLNMLKSGDTMTGDIAWTSSDRGLTWSYDTDGASIKFYSIGEGDPNTRLEFNTSNNGTEYFIWTHTYEAGNKENLMRLDANDNFGNIRLQLYGNIEASGKVQATNFIGDGSQVSNISATNIVSGRVSNARLNGSYDIDISGNSRTVTSITSGQVTSALGYTPANLAGSTLAGDWTWNSTGRGLDWSFNTDGAFIRYYNTGDGDTDSRLEFETRDNNNEYFRWTHTPSGSSNYELMRLVPNSSGNSALTVRGTITSTGSTTASSFIGNGSNLTSLNANNLSSGIVPSGRLNGTYNISITGNAATVTAITSGQITSALGYVPVNPSLLTNQQNSPISATTGTFTDVLNIAAGSTKGIRFPNDAYGGGSDTATITLETTGGEATKMTFRMSNDADDQFRFIAPSDNGITMNGHVMIHAGNYNNYAPTRTGVGASGTWSISILGTASSANTATNATNLTGGSVTATSGSFSGRLNVSAGAAGGIHFPNDAYGGSGDTARITLESAGGEATRMRFTMTNDADDYFEFVAPNANGLKFNGNTVIHAGNISSYQPGRDGTGAYGTWPINVSGNAASVSSITSGQVTTALGYTPANGSGPGSINGDQNYQDYLLRRPTIIDYSLYHNALGSRTGSVIIDCESGNYVSCTAVGAINFGFSNPASGQRATGIILELTNGGNYTVTWPSSVRWPAGTAPTLTVSGVDVLVFITDDGGSTWRGAVSMSDSR